MCLRWCASFWKKSEEISDEPRRQRVETLPVGPPGPLDVRSEEERDDDDESAQEDDRQRVPVHREPIVSDNRAPSVIGLTKSFYD